jgi:DNA-binding IclR family transcriptional regulator
MRLEREEQQQGPATSVSERVVRILAVFAEQLPPLTLSQLSHRAALPLTTTHRIVTELRRNGALERDDSGRYRVGPLLFAIASCAAKEEV